MPVNPEQRVNILRFQSDVSNGLRGAGSTYFGRIQYIIFSLSLAKNSLKPVDTGHDTFDGAWSGPGRRRISAWVVIEVARGPHIE